MAISRDKLIIGGVVVLGGLSLLVYKQAQKDDSLGKPTVAETDFPTIAAPDDIDKISITNGDKPEIVLQKVPDPTAPAAEGDAGAPTKWQVVKPVHADANQQTAKDLVTNLHDLKVESKINLTLDDAVRKDKQLDAAHVVHVQAWKGADKKLDELFGKSGTAGQLFVLADKPDAVWAAKGYSAFLYTKEAKDFRNKEILKFDDVNATEATIVNAHGTLAFTKSGDKWSATFDKKPLPRFDESKIKDMLRAYKTLTADDFGDGKSADETGLDKPEATVSIALTGSSPLVVQIGKVASGTNRWIKRADGDIIYQLPAFAADWATSDVTKYETSGDGGAPAAKAAKPKTASKK
jgi:hypothetical protein